MRRNALCLRSGSLVGALYPLDGPTPYPSDTAVPVVILCASGHTALPCRVLRSVPITQEPATCALSQPIRDMQLSKNVTGALGLGITPELGTPAQETTANLWQW